MTADETVLGHVMTGYEHVHFTELDHGVAVNPLAVGHLAPYDDTTKPQVGRISFRACRSILAASSTPAARHLIRLHLSAHLSIPAPDFRSAKEIYAEMC